ncbi:hypothetical protein BGZ83_007550 [Gryganskiella cystojenkinii]|nr:hypothetical protein BGZ83_007550 [Gryganskiella cystojenkinii]
MVAPRAGLATIRTMFTNNNSNSATAASARRHTISQTPSTSLTSSNTKKDQALLYGLAFATSTLNLGLGPRSQTTSAERYVAAVEREQQLQDFQLSTVNDRGYFIPPGPEDKSFKEHMRETDPESFFERIILQTPPDRVQNFLSTASTISPYMFSDPVPYRDSRRRRSRGEDENDNNNKIKRGGGRHQSIPSTFIKESTAKKEMTLNIGSASVTATVKPVQPTTPAPTAQAMSGASPTDQQQGNQGKRQQQQEQATKVSVKNTLTTAVSNKTSNINSKEIVAVTATPADTLSTPPASPPITVAITMSKDEGYFPSTRVHSRSSIVSPSSVPPTPPSSFSANNRPVSHSSQHTTQSRILPTTKEMESKKIRHRARAQLSFLTGSKPSAVWHDDEDDDEEDMESGYDHNDVLFKKEASRTRSTVFLEDDLLDSLLFSSSAPTSTSVPSSRSSSPPDLVLDTSSSSSTSSSAASSPEVSPRPSASSSSGAISTKEVTRQKNARKLWEQNDFGGVLPNLQ